jgi:hypothetical protein
MSCLDVLMDRGPHAEASAVVWTAIAGGFAEGLLPARAITTAHYPIRKDMGVARAAQIVSAILAVFEIAPVDKGVIEEAVELRLADFEDAVTSAAARRVRHDLQPGSKGISPVSLFDVFLLKRPFRCSVLDNDVKIESPSPNLNTIHEPPQEPDPGGPGFPQARH